MGLDDLLGEKEKIDNQVNEMKSKSTALEKKETPEERKARLKAQRDKILAKKKAEREAELQQYQQDNKPSTNNQQQKQQSPPNKAQGDPLAQEEAEKRSNVYSKLSLK